MSARIACVLASMLAACSPYEDISVVWRDAQCKIDVAPSIQGAPVFPGCIVNVSNAFGAGSVDLKLWQAPSMNPGFFEVVISRGAVGPDLVAAPYEIPADPALHEAIVTFADNSKNGFVGTGTVTLDKLEVSRVDEAEMLDVEMRFDRVMLQSEKDPNNKRTISGSLQLSGNDATYAY
jgi:hypothetical protein